MFKSYDFLTRSPLLPELPGIYIVEPLGSRLRVIDNTCTHIMQRVNNSNIKFGNPQNVRRKFRNYYYDNDGDV